MLQAMRKCAFGAAAAAALFVVPGSAFSQSIEIGPGGVRLRGECEQLRRACENKDVLARISHTTLAQFPDFVAPVGDFSGLRALAWRRLPQSSWTSSW
jgi:hypothetical protein